MDSVPAPYLDAWARLQVRKPGDVSDAEWQQAIVDGGLFLGKWGNIAADNGWTDRDLFDAPCKGVPGGLIWFLRGAPVASAKIGGRRLVLRESLDSLMRSKEAS